jgi:hypothetical protein
MKVSNLLNLPIYLLSNLINRYTLDDWNIVKVAFGKDNKNHIILNNDTLKVYYPKGSYSPSKLPVGGVGFFASPKQIFMTNEVIFKYQVLSENFKEKHKGKVE